MPLEVLQVERSDFSEIGRIDEAAMANNGITQAIGIALALEGRSRTEFFLDYIGGSYEKDKNSFWKVVDTDTGEMISVAKYSFHHVVDEPKTTDKEDPTPAGDKQSATTHEIPDAEVAEKERPSARLIEIMTELFADWQRFSREKMQGTPHANLHYIATHPDHQRRGAATLLLQKGAEMADEAGLDTFLQASAEGLATYTKMGYRVEQTNSIDLAEFGIDKVEVRQCMRRPCSKRH